MIYVNIEPMRRGKRNGLCNGSGLLMKCRDEMRHQALKVYVPSVCLGIKSPALDPCFAYLHSKRGIAFSAKGIAEFLGELRRYFRQAGHCSLRGR